MCDMGSIVINITLTHRLCDMESALIYITLTNTVTWDQQSYISH